MRTAGTSRRASTACTPCGTSTLAALLDAGENIKAVSEYMGHADPGLTLRVYSHLMPDSRERARRATVFQRIFGEDHGPQTAQ